MHLNEIHGKWKDRVDSYCVYIQEAYPADGQQSAKNLDEAVLYEQPKSIDEREALARVCMLRLGLRMPTLFDNMDNEVDRLYAALPDRLYLLDENGVVLFRSVLGSPGFDVEAWYAAIVEYLNLPAVAAARGGSGR